MGNGNNLLELAQGKGNLLVRVRLHCIQPLLGVASLNGAFAVDPARVLNSGSISVGGVAGDHVCGVVVSRWFWCVFCGMGVMVVRESVKCGRRSRCLEIYAESCKND